MRRIPLYFMIFRSFLGYPRFLAKILNPKFILNERLNNREFRLRKLYLRTLPIHAQIETTNECNLNCKMCPRHLQKRKKGQMTLEKFQKIVDQLPFVATVDLHGWGEPLLVKDLFKIVDYAYKYKGILCSFATNGTLLNNETIFKIINSHLYRVLFSIDTTDPEKVRDYQDFQMLIKNIKKLVNLQRNTRRSLRIQNGITLMKGNLDDIPNVIKLLNQVGVEDITAWAVTTHDQKLLGSQFDLQITEDVMKKVKALSFSGKVRFLGKLKRLLENNAEETNKICRAPWRSCFITWDGFVYPCCHLINERYCFGNVFETSFQEIWNSPEYRQFRAAFVNNPPEICKRCGW